MSESDEPNGDQTRPEQAVVRLCSVDHAPWQTVQLWLLRSLAVHGLEALLSPSTLIVHDVLESAVQTLQLAVFRRILTEEGGLELPAEDAPVRSLFASELHEHGSHNIVRACHDGGFLVAISFPALNAPECNVVIQLDVPVRWSADQCKTTALIDALGYVIEAAPHGEGSRVVLRWQQQRSASDRAHAPKALAPAEQLDSLGRIAQKLGYGQILFSSVGEVVAVSPPMLTLLRLSREEATQARLTQAIPVGFFNDIVWGLAMAEDNRAFENYRIRINLPWAPTTSILFNVSGFSDPQGIVHSLWQKVSLDDSGTQLGEGSILSEARVHNITRNYVPRLVEQKARQAVRLGLTTLQNEQRPLAVLFCDIVGFTSYVESHAANESTIDTLNSILRRVAGSVSQHRGFIDKFMGDAAMALFDDPADAVNAAIDMQGYSEDINSLRERAGQQTLQLRIGIHWGDVVIGNVGTAERLDWTAIGDVVNTASRMEKACTPGHILVSRGVRDAIDAARPGEFAFGPLYGLKVKGKTDELAVCWALGEFSRTGPLPRI